MFRENSAPTRGTDKGLKVSSSPIKSKASGQPHWSASGASSSGFSLQGSHTDPDPPGPLWVETHLPAPEACWVFEVLAPGPPHGLEQAHDRCAQAPVLLTRLPCQMQISHKEVAMTVPWACRGGKAGQGETGSWGDEGEQVHSTQVAPRPWELWLEKARSSDLAKFSIWLETQGWRKRSQERRLRCTIKHQTS